MPLPFLPPFLSLLLSPPPLPLTSPSLLPPLLPPSSSLPPSFHLTEEACFEITLEIIYGPKWHYSLWFSLTCSSLHACCWFTIHIHMKIVMLSDIGFAFQIHCSELVMYRGIINLSYSCTRISDLTARARPVDYLAAVGLITYVAKGMAIQLSWMTEGDCDGYAPIAESVRGQHSSWQAWFWSNKLFSRMYCK